ncbi:MAG: hypothetical protein ACR650_09735 [Methylocystis sp.]
MASEDIKRIADRYIARDGGLTKAQKGAERRAEDVLNVAAFIAWHDNGDLWGGVKREEALAAFSRLVGAPIQKLEQIVRGEKDERRKRK